MTASQAEPEKGGLRENLEAPVMLPLQEADLIAKESFPRVTRARFTALDANLTLASCCCY